MIFSRKLHRLALALAMFSAAVSAHANDTIRIGLNPGVTIDVVQFVKQQAAAQGLDVQIVEISDWISPNIALNDGNLDVNFYQNTAFLNTQLKQRKLKLAPVASIWSIQSGLFSRKLKKIDDLPVGASVAIASDPLNGARGLLLLEKAGVIKLKDGVGIEATRFDIVSNPKKVKIVELEGPQLARALDDVYLSAISPYVYLPAGIDPATAFVTEDLRDPLFHQVVVARENNKDDPKVQKFVAIFRSPAVKDYIQKKYPAFKVLW
jgi:D-methionine transport system substrate-binding protein